MAIDSTSSEEQMVLWSFDYIRNRPDITTDQLPEILVKFWTIPGFLTHWDYQPNSSQVIVFMYILRMNEWVEEELEDFVGSFRFNQLFYYFQVILFTIDYCRNNHLEITPFPIFKLENYPLPEQYSEEQLLAQYNIIIGHSAD